MTGCGWIICERTSRWAAAMRVSLDRDFVAGGAHVYEVRNLRDLSARLAARPDALVAIEVDRANLAEVLFWLAGAAQRFPCARYVAMIDWPLAEDRQAGLRSDEAREVEQALVEAGAMLVERSPRQCSTLVALACRHAAVRSAERVVGAHDDLSPVDEVWASLPWQKP